MNFKQIIYGTSVFFNISVFEWNKPIDGLT